MLEKQELNQQAGRSLGLVLNLHTVLCYRCARNVELKCGDASSRSVVERFCYFYFFYCALKF